MIVLLSSALEDSDDPRGDRRLYAGSEFVLSPAELKMDDTPLDSISLLWLC